MRRLLFAVLLAASVLPCAGPARAQATADQLNKLSLEALTARPAGGSEGSYVRRGYRRSSQPRAYGRSRYRRPAPYVRNKAPYVRNNRSAGRAQYRRAPAAHRPARSVYRGPHRR